MADAGVPTTLELWQSSAGVRRIRSLSAHPFRSVESQHLVSTRKLVDTDEEQRVLEELIDAQKPPRKDDTSRSLHYLLYTPFRYPPLRHGSRFGTRGEPGLWYGSLERRTVLAETAYYRLLFLEGSSAELAPLDLELTLFRVRVKTPRGVDLTRTPFAAHAAELASKSHYAATQALGQAMREAGVEAFRYRSARDVEGGTNLGIFSARAFAESKPSGIESWFCRVEHARVEFSEKSLFERRSLAFSREQFLVRGRLPSPAV
jgi:hypothetical protein